MTRLFLDESIRCTLDDSGRPLHFQWHGRRHVVERVVQQWQVDTDWWAPDGRVHRDYWAAITAEGVLLVFFLDHSDGKWYLAKIYD